MDSMAIFKAWCLCNSSNNTSSPALAFHWRTKHLKFELEGDFLQPFIAFVNTNQRKLIPN